MYEQQYQQIMLSKCCPVSPSCLVSSATTKQSLLNDKTSNSNRKRRETKQMPLKSDVNVAPISYSQNTKSNYPSYCTNDNDGNKTRNSQKWQGNFHRRFLAIIVSWILNRSVIFVISNTNDVTTLLTHRVQIEGEYNKHNSFKMKRDDFSIPKGLLVTTGSTSASTKELVHHDVRGKVELARMGEESLVQKQGRHTRRVQKENDDKETGDNKNPEKPEDDKKDKEPAENNRAPPTEDTTPTTEQNTVPSLSPNYTTGPTVSDEDADPPSPSPSEDMATNSTNSTDSMTMQLSEFEIQASVSNDYLSDASNKTIDDLRMAFEEYLEEELLFISLRSIDLELKEAHSTNTNMVEKETDTSTSKSENVVDGGESRNNGERVVGSDLRHRNVHVLTFGYDAYNNRLLSASNKTNDVEDNSKNSTSKNITSSSTNETQSNSTVSSLGGLSYYRLLFTGSATFAGSVIPDESVLKEEQSFLLINYTEQIDVYMSTFVPNRTVQVERISVMNNDTMEATWTRDDSDSTNSDKSLMGQMSNQTIIIVTVCVIASFFVITALFVVRYKYHRNAIERKKAAKKKNKKSGKDKKAGASSETSAVDADIRPVKTGSTDADEENNNVKKSNAYEIVEVSGIDSEEEDDDDDNSNNKNYSAKYTSPQSKRGGNINRFDDNASCGSGSMSDIISVTDWGDHSIGSTITAPRGSKHQRFDKLSDADKRLINGNGTSPDVLNVCSTPTSSTHERMMFD